MAQTTSYTSSQQARAAQLVSESFKWTRATRKRDGLAFVIFPSSKPERAYYATETACSCPGFFHRGACSHVLAVRLEAEQAREQMVAPSRYDIYWPAEDDSTLTSAF